MPTVSVSLKRVLAPLASSSWRTAHFLLKSSPHRVSQAVAFGYGAPLSKSSCTPLSTSYFSLSGCAPGSLSGTGSSGRYGVSGGLSGCAGRPGISGGAGRVFGLQRRSRQRSAQDRWLPWCQNCC